MAVRHGGALLYPEPGSVALPERRRGEADTRGWPASRSAAPWACRPCYPFQRRPGRTAANTLHHPSLDDHLDPRFLQGSGLRARTIISMTGRESSTMVVAMSVRRRWASSVQDGSESRGVESGRALLRPEPEKRGQAGRDHRLLLRPRSGQWSGGCRFGAPAIGGPPTERGSLVDRRALPVVGRLPRTPRLREEPSCITTNRPYWTPSSGGH